MKASRALLCGAGAAMVVAACMMDIEPPTASPTNDASTDTSPPDAPVSSPDASPGNTDAAIEGECRVAADCVGGSGCITPSCVSGRCVFDVCPTSDSCHAAHCDRGANRCEAAAEVGYLAGSFDVPTTTPLQLLPCWSSSTLLSRCVAAVGSYLFVIDGPLSLAAYFLGDPREATPKRIGVPLTVGPVQIVASGDRVFFVGKPAVQGANALLPVGWVDLPTNPLADAMPVTQKSLDYRAGLAAPLLLPEPGGGVVVALPTRETGLLRPPGDGELVLYSPNPDLALSIVPPSGSVSGERIVASTVATTGVVTLGTLSGAGTSAAHFNASLTASGFGAVGGSQLFVGSNEASVVASFATGPGDAGTVPNVNRVALAIVTDSPDGGISVTRTVQLQTYPSTNAATRLTTTPAVFDGGALAVHATADRDASVAVVVEPNDAGMPVATTRSAVIPATVAQVVATVAGSENVYVGFASAATESTTTFRVFRPTCAPLP